MYQFFVYSKVNWGHVICPLCSGCLLFGGSVIRGFTVLPHPHLYTPYFLLKLLKKSPGLNKQVVQLRRTTAWVPKLGSCTRGSIKRHGHKAL